MFLHSYQNSLDNPLAVVVDDLLPANGVIPREMSDTPQALCIEGCEPIDHQRCDIIGHSIEDVIQATFSGYHRLGDPIQCMTV